MKRQREPGMIIILMPYWSFWEHTVQGLRQIKQRLLETVVLTLSKHFVVPFSTLLEPSNINDVIKAITSNKPDAILVLVTMAAPPAMVSEVVMNSGRTPTVVWAITNQDIDTQNVSEATITSEGATVGTPMIVSDLYKRGYNPALVVGDHRNNRTHKQLVNTLKAAVVASKFISSRIGILSKVPEGYTHQELDPEYIHAQLGPEIVKISPQDFWQRYETVTDNDIKSFHARLLEQFVPMEHIPRISMERSIKATLAFVKLANDFNFDAIAINCHTSDLRLNDKLGIAPCFALGWLTSEGIPCTCTADLNTVLAMRLGKLLGAATLYHEIEFILDDKNLAVLANTGEFDLNWSSANETTHMCLNRWYLNHDPICGICGCFNMKAGPATLVSFVHHQPGSKQPKPKILVAEGYILEEELKTLHTVNGAFRFKDGRIYEKWQMLVSHGIGHHMCCLTGHCAKALNEIARYLEIECIQI